MQAVQYIRQLPVHESGSTSGIINVKESDRITTLILYKQQSCKYPLYSFHIGRLQENHRLKTNK